MDCLSNHSIFLRANGTLSCWDDYGSFLTLQPFEQTIDYGKDVYLGRVFQHIRKKLQQDEMPFPEFCTQCFCMAEHLEFNTYFYKKKEIFIFQVEPTIRCTLTCPCCLSQNERKTRILPPYDLELSALEKILSDLKRNHIKIQTIDFQGHGEPLLNKNVWDMIRLAKSLFPTSKITMCTNAHGDYQPEYLNSGIDEILFAIDGIDQQSYVPYRRKGDFKKAYTFMKDFARHAHRQGKSIRTIWKYILFAHNDSPEQLQRAQELAKDAQVTDLFFVITHVGPKSSRIVEKRQIPIIENGVAVRLESFVPELESIWKSIDDARKWCDQKKYKKAEHCLQYSAAMIGRCFRFDRSNSHIPEIFQVAIHELVDVHKRFSKHNGKNTILDEIRTLINKVNISKRKAKNAVIQRQANLIQHQKQVIDEMQNSLSWKITKPMRWLLKKYPNIRWF